jgi:hemerythrin-like domain-containing protein
MRPKNMAMILTLRRKPSHEAIQLLRNDHRRVRRLLRRFANADGARREKFRTRLEHELSVHTQLEEEIFYPAYRQAALNGADRRLYFEAVEDHNAIDLILPQVNASVDADELAAKAKVLRRLVRRHIRREERRLFRRAKDLFGRAERLSLGRQMQQRRTELEHPKKGRKKAQRAA